MQINLKRKLIILKNNQLFLFISLFIITFSIFFSVLAIRKTSNLNLKASQADFYISNLDTTLSTNSIKTELSKNKADSNASVSNTIIVTKNKLLTSKGVVGFTFPKSGNYTKAIFRIKPEKINTKYLTLYQLGGDIKETDTSLSSIENYSKKLIGEMPNVQKSLDGYLEFNVTDAINSLNDKKINFLLENSTIGTNTYFTRESSTPPQLLLYSPSSSNTVFTLKKLGNSVARAGDYAPILSNIISPTDSINYLKYDLNADSRLTYLGSIKKGTCIDPTHSCLISSYSPPIVSVTANQSSSQSEIDGDIVEIWYKLPDDGIIGAIYNTNLVTDTFELNTYTNPITDATINGTYQIALTNNVPYCNYPYSESHRSIKAINSITNAQLNIPYEEINITGETGLFAKVELYGITNDSIPPTQNNTIHYGTLENTTFTQNETGTSQHLIIAIHGPMSPEYMTATFTPRILSLIIDGQPQTIYLPDVRIYNGPSHDEWMAFYPTTDGSTYHSNSNTTNYHQINVYPEIGISALAKVSTLPFSNSMLPYSNGWRSSICTFGDQPPLIPTITLTPTPTILPSPTPTPIVNNPPIWVSPLPSVSDAIVGQSYSESIAGFAIDPEGDSISYSINDILDPISPWLQMLPTGQMLGTPQSTDVFSNARYVIRATDEHGSYASAILFINILTAPPVPQVILNSGSNLNCTQKCSELNLTCSSIGTNDLATNGKYYDFISRGCQLLPLGTATATCNQTMFSASTNTCLGITADWTKCNCIN